PLRLVHGCAVPYAAYPSGVVNMASVRAAMRDQGRRWLDLARAEVPDVDPDTEPELVLAMSAPEPALMAQSRQASLVVVGSSGLGSFTGLLVGSTAVHLAARAECPVVVVRAEADSGPVVVGVDGSRTSESAIAFAFAEASVRGVELVAVHAWRD